jgi:hypothetical protein
MLKGYVDRADETTVSGWAWDQDEPERRLVLQLCDGEDVVSDIVADVLRPDLASAGVGDGRYGFAIRLPPNLLTGPVHLLRVRYKETGADLNKSPQRVYPARSGIDASLESWFSRQIDNCAAAAVEPSDLAPFIALCSNALSRLLSAEARMLNASASVPVASVDRAALPARLKQALGNMLETCPAIHVPIYQEPRLSIVIAGSAQFRDNYDCIRSILASRSLRDYEIVFINVTGTTDMALAPFVIGGGIRFVSTPQASPALAAYRMGLSIARGSRLLFLGHVASVAPEAILTLSQTLDVRERPAVVMPRLVSRDGRLVEAGAMMGVLAARQPVGQLELQSASRYRVLRQSDDISSRAFMIDRATLALVGGFDGIEPLGEFGMTDIAFRLRAAGGDVLMQGFADVFVSGAGEAGSVDLRGRRNFLARWQTVLPAAAAPGEAKRPQRALIIDERLPDPTRDAASVALLSHAEALVQLGYQTEFVPVDHDVSAHDDGRSLFMRGIEAHIGSEDADALLRSRADQFDLIYLHRLSVARRLLPLCRETQTKARIVYSVADLHGLRVQRQAEAVGDDKLRAEGAALEQAERQCLAACDVALTHSLHEEAWIEREVPGTRVVRALWSYRVNTAPKPVTGREGFCFLGTYLHKPNIDAVRHFLATQWPPLRQATGSVFEIAGSHLELGGFATGRDGVVARGYVADASAYLGGIRVMLAPLRFGAGVKGKVLISLAEGLPCVVTETAAEGIALPKSIRTLLVAKNEAEFIAKAAALHRDDALWSKASALVHSWARENLSQEAITRQLAGELMPR